MPKAGTVSLASSPLPACEEGCLAPGGDPLPGQGEKPSSLMPAYPVIMNPALRL